MKAFTQLSDCSSTGRGPPRYLDKTPKPTNYHNDKSQEHRQRDSKADGQDCAGRDPSPVLMCNASKPSKKMPSYKPQPKL